ncbi:MAG: peptidase S53 [Sulfobacillus acidophilus]|uniref:Peptidase S53 n=1 Tax=Sulfobacillus acidophilus TaxID=53633 RepID=A0A2T2WF42_9FIRM|nr:MAG: peptidase S53 [Sulfobacillus acidophilus]
MSIRPYRLLVLCIGAISLLLMSSVTDAAPTPAVMYQPGRFLLPSTPAYRSDAVTHDLQVITSSHRAHTVDVVVDSRRRIEALTAYANATANRMSPLFHRFLSPRELDQRFGPTPTMLSQAESRMKAAGWRVLSHDGMVVTARVPAASARPGLPVSPDIWSMTGFQPHGLIRNASSIAPMPVVVHQDARLAQTLVSVRTSAASLSGEDFNQPPVVVQQTTEANGDVVSIMSWNSLVRSSVPTGLPINLFVTVQDSDGNFLPIENVDNLDDSNGSLVSYGTAAMPDSSNTLWQVPIAAWQDIAPGDLFTLQVVLTGGVKLNAGFPLPAFTGPATVLTPLDAQQLNELSGLPQMPRNPGGIALFAIGSPPSVKNLQLYLAQNSPATPVPKVDFEYENGATASEYGATGDSQESQLDLEAAAGAAPGATIYDYIYPENDSNDPLIAFLTDLSQQNTAKIASLSYGFFGENLTTLSTLMSALTAEGITVLEASGDQGAWNAGSDPGPVGLSSLEQIPSVLSVGGVNLAAPAKTSTSGNTVSIDGPVIADAWGGDFLNGIPVAVAQAYTNQNAASSGGYSNTIPIPSWQTAFLPAGAPGFGVPIIASLAGYPGMSGYLQGQNVIFGGTSLAAPLTAGWLDDVEANLNLTHYGLGDINPLIFHAATSVPNLFNQVLWGQDGVYSVTNTQPGSWNPLVGLGLIDWGQFLLDYDGLVPNASTAVSLTVNPRVMVGHSESITAYVRGIENPLFRFLYRSPQTGAWTVSGPFATPQSYSFVPVVPGVYDVLVQVRAADGRIFTARQSFLVWTSAPMVSALTVKTSAPTHVLRAGDSWTIVAHALDSGTHPEYQFRLAGTGISAHIIQGWTTKPVLVLKHLRVGTYAVTVDALDRVEVEHHDWAAMFRETVRATVRP